MEPRKIGDFTQKPLIIFWETTKACDLSCKHCRASAIGDPMQGELDHDESLEFVRSVAAFGKPYPRLVLTGGDPLRKAYLFDIIREARDSGISISITPAVTERLTYTMVDELKEAGVRSFALSLDGSDPSMHDGLRGIPGTFDRTLRIMDYMLENDLSVQVNTTVMRSNVHDLSRVLQLLWKRRIMTWAPFFLIRTGRGNELEDLSPREYEDVNLWLNFASLYGIRIRTVEAPIFRRLSIQRSNGMKNLGGILYRELRAKTLKKLGKPGKRSMSYYVGSRDGYGVVFVSHDGYISPSGFLPVQIESIRNKGIAEIYRTNSTLRAIREASKYTGKCRLCEYSKVCGGSRARSYYDSGDMYGSDPSCIYEPAMEA